MRNRLKVLEPGHLQVERLPSGRRFLLRDLNLLLNDEPITIPAGFDTDYSSWPRWLPGPNYQRIDLAGIVHDYAFRYATLGEEGRSLTYLEANRVWFQIARAGTDESRCPWLWAWAGRLGLAVGAWPTWICYRRQDDDATMAQDLQGEGG
ncbi:MAG TPA: DUF1353 domain-containing protein [Anaerolineae bacterium]|nr:DUF1353 domain-containing protein [Anaerolineae bacterium]